MEWNRELIGKVRRNGCPFNLAFLNFVETLYLEAEDEIEENLTLPVRLKWTWIPFLPPHFVLHILNLTPFPFPVSKKTQKTWNKILPAWWSQEASPCPSNAEFSSSWSSQKEYNGGSGSSPSPSPSLWMGISASDSWGQQHLSTSELGGTDFQLASLGFHNWIVFKPPFLLLEVGLLDLVVFFLFIYLSPGAGLLISSGQTGWHIISTFTLSLKEDPCNLCKGFWE